MKLTADQRSKLEAMLAAGETIRNAAQHEDRPMSTEEEAKYDEVMGKYDAEVKKIDQANRHAAARDRLDAMAAASALSVGRKTSDSPSPSAATELAAPTDGIDGPVATIDVPGYDQPIAIEPGMPGAIYERSQPAYMEAFEHYLREGGQPSATLEQGDPGGAPLAPMIVSTQMVNFLDDLNPIRGICNVYPTQTTGGSLGIVSIDTDVSDAEWTAEVPVTSVPLDTDLAFKNREMEPHLLSKMVQISQRLLRGSIFPITQIIMERLAYKHALAEEAAFMTGDGTNQPLGVFVANADGVPASRDITTDAGDVDTFDGDDVIATKHHCKPQYWSRGTWVMHRLMLSEVRKLKDSTGQYLWQPGLAQDAAGTLLDQPIAISEQAPSTKAASQYAMAFGDFSRYVVVDFMTFTIQTLTERYAEKNLVAYIGRREGDGQPIVGEAFARLQYAAA